MTRGQTIALGVFLVGVLIAAGLLGAAWYFVETPLDPTSNSTVVFTIESGESRRLVSQRLQSEGLVSWGEGVRWYGRYAKIPLQAGEFELSPAMSPRTILEILAHGQPILHRLHFSEGLTMREVADAVNATGLTTAERFLEACRDQEFLRDKGLNATDAEGYLFPETYFFPRIPKQDPYPILTALLEEFRKNTAQLPQANNPEEMHRIVILASLVEKETGQPDERGVIAGVYANRLEREMLLQCDPTVIYGLGDAFDGNLKKVHLLDPNNPYNTYVRPGLPPGPICSPGKASLTAAAEPEKHAFLYFVAKGDGWHHFSRSLDEHTNAVIKYQRKGRPFPRQSPQE